MNTLDNLTTGFIGILIVGALILTTYALVTRTKNDNENKRNDQNRTN